MKKLFEEFKKFITRGNVIDLAVGMIIGAAFTAIVTALVNSVFKPLINMIPMDGLNGLITMLVPRDANGIEVAFGSDAIDLTKSVYIDWGALITAIINFLLTAIILFAIVKAINALREGGEHMKANKFTPEQRAEMKEKGLSAKQMRELIAAREKEAEEKAAAEAAEAAVEAERNRPKTTEELLAEILEQLKTQNTAK